ncbi:porin [Burkholderia multivorans]|uniref:porin n=1 Tax=Burkholderia multivorans TaxID=87883 RepID=UPI002018DEF2|nr:porin [Burkholderia multivorans]MCL4661350.1 porin [Burkholderia multivorans]MCO1352780.1 porin [Burkholderia multivorans]MCO1413373.1 porin [Burkholderia multivorans]MCO1446436.1 porin [Burkholderia multivorans]UQP46849.1 porin [Burkholderia multivorans]
MLKITGSRLNWVAGVVILLACGVARAQGSVTLYGIADGGLLYTSKTAGSNGQNAGHNFSMVDSGSMPTSFGLKGVENLGGGLTASFDLESGVSLANGGFNDSNGNFFGRQAWVALGGDFGQITAGVQFSPFFLAVYESDPRGMAYLGSALVNYADNVLVTGAMNSNAVSYTSPKIAGFTGSALLALGGQAGNFQAGRQYSASLKYEGGSIMVNAAIYHGNSGGTAQTPVPSTVEFEGRELGLAYTFGSLTAKASFVNYKVTGSFDSNVYSGGIDYYLLPQLDISGGVYVTSDRNDSSNHSLVVALGTQYFLSKRTALYAQVGVVNNHGTMNTGLALNGALNGVKGTTVGANVGIRQSF